jgi:Short C-terminal domain
MWSRGVVMGMFLRPRRRLLLLAAQRDLEAGVERHSTSDLERLAELHASGKLSDAEFEAARSRLLRSGALRR